MLSPIPSLSVPSDALQAEGDGLGDFAVCPPSIIYDRAAPSALRTYCLLSCIMKHMT